MPLDLFQQLSSPSSTDHTQPQIANSTDQHSRLCNVCSVHHTGHVAMYYTWYNRPLARRETSPLFDNKTFSSYCPWNLDGSHRTNSNVVVFPTPQARPTDSASSSLLRRLENSQNSYLSVQRRPHLRYPHLCLPRHAPHQS